MIYDTTVLKVFFFLSQMACRWQILLFHLYFFTKLRHSFRTIATRTKRNLGSIDEFHKLVYLLPGSDHTAYALMKINLVRGMSICQASVLKYFSSNPALLLDLS